MVDKFAKIGKRFIYLPSITFIEKAEIGTLWYVHFIGGEKIPLNQTDFAELELIIKFVGCHNGPAKLELENNK